jgi:hypothetical protein
VIQNQVEGISYFSPSSPSPSTMTTFCRAAGAARGSRTLREGLPMSKHDEVLTASAVNRANARQVTRDPTEGMPHVQPWSDRGICNVTTPLTPPTASPLHRADTSPPPLRVPSNPNSMSVTTPLTLICHRQHHPSSPPVVVTPPGTASPVVVSGPGVQEQGRTAEIPFRCAPCSCVRRRDRVKSSTKHHKIQTTGTGATQ